MSFEPVCSVSVRSSPESTSSQRSQRRAYFPLSYLKQYRLNAGEWVQLGGDSSNLQSAQIWPNYISDDDCVLLSEQVCAEIKADKVDIYRLTDQDVNGKAQKIIVSEVSAAIIPQGRETTWTSSALRESLNYIKYVRRGSQFTSCNGRWEVIEIITKPGPTEEPLVNGLNDLSLGSHPPTWYTMDWRTQVEVSSNNNKPGSPPSAALPSYMRLYQPGDQSASAYNTLGGLDTQIKTLRRLVDLPLSHPEVYKRFGLAVPKGALLHGLPGTGKTALSRAVAASRPDCSCIVVNGPELSSAYHGESEERLRGVFEQARQRRPCLVVLDEIDALCPRRDGDGGEVEKRIVATLLTLMDGMETDHGVFVIGSTNRQNSIDPALRRPGRFDREIELGVPDLHGRISILEILIRKLPHSLSNDQIHDLASRTHGYVGADLAALIRDAASSVIEEAQDLSHVSLDLQHIETVLAGMRPSTMREVFIEIPDVYWSDIGGQAEVKQKLRECVEWPLRRQDTFKRLGIDPPRGVLLYGPPGCSKTMIAKALATESGLNFLAVKGPELINKYVGESERSVREVFRKARGAAPSIIFFDEIDAIASSRSDIAAHSGVLTSLLNEMDGVEELKGVIVVAATNRPEVLDPAILRPNRLDRILFVGPPDLDSRVEIFRLRQQKMSVEPGMDITKLAQMTEGCSGAEIASICQDAAMLAMNEDPDAQYVSEKHFTQSALSIRRRITPDVLLELEKWRDQSGVRNA